MSITLYHILNKETHRKSYLYFFKSINFTKKFGYKKYNQKLHHIQYYDGKFKEKFP